MCLLAASRFVPVATSFLRLTVVFAVMPFEDLRMFAPGA
ncbi:hypothetical protein PLANPX_6067 [Lacipirellula parvula]|uniref:Uncharacterized protein n=1 Tax=Lacipirellula parvula TaxID=2650471 RepID=A0A5K7XJA1_9BACT|nr:hypothetical protein PLANPX_6067 [Lacipirellula parvula]